MSTGRGSRFASPAAALACGLVLACPAQAEDEPERVTGVITGVLDGDTLRVQLRSGPTVVRLAYVDAPEMRQPDGIEAARALYAKLPGTRVKLEVLSEDPSGWMTAVVYDGDDNINAWVVKEGHAWVDRAQATDPSYCFFENAARSVKRGLWSYEEWLAPWEYREGGKGKAMRYTDYRKADAASCIAELKPKT